MIVVNGVSIYNEMKQKDLRIYNFIIYPNNTYTIKHNPLNLVNIRFWPTLTPAPSPQNITPKAAVKSAL